MIKSTDKDNWWQQFYEQAPVELLLERSDPAVLQATVEFLCDKLRLTNGCAVFDQCCGAGDLSIPLIERGVRVFGVDLCDKFIKMTQQRSQKYASNGAFFCDDAFAFVTPQLCDAAFNWWTSFGYSQDDSRNMLMLKRAWQSLQPGGYFALDYPNMHAFLRDFKSRVSQRYPQDGGEVELIRDTSIDLIKGLRRQRWTHIMPDGSELVHDTFVRLYMPSDLYNMLTQCGFEDVRFYGSVQGDELILDGQRCICVARKLW